MKKLILLFILFSALVANAETTKCIFNDAVTAEITYTIDYDLSNDAVIILYKNGFKDPDVIKQQIINQVNFSCSNSALLFSSEEYTKSHKNQKLFTDYIIDQVKNGLYAIAYEDGKMTLKLTNGSPEHRYPNFLGDYKITLKDFQIQNIQIISK